MVTLFQIWICLCAASSWCTLQLHKGHSKINLNLFCFQKTEWNSQIFLLGQIFWLFLHFHRLFWSQFQLLKFMLKSGMSELGIFKSQPQGCQKQRACSLPLPALPSQLLHLLFWAHVMPVRHISRASFLELFSLRQNIPCPWDEGFRFIHVHAEM